MEWFDRGFDLFARYLMPFVLFWIAWDRWREHPRTRSSVIWTIVGVGVGTWGLVALVVSLT